MINKSFNSEWEIACGSAEIARYVRLQVQAINRFPNINGSLLPSVRMSKEAGVYFKQAWEYDEQLYSSNSHLTETLARQGSPAHSLASL
jgi:hypothetical protein